MQSKYVEINKSEELHLVCLEIALNKRASKYRKLGLTLYYEKTMIKYFSLRIQSKLIAHNNNSKIFTVGYVNSKIRDYNNFLDNSKYHKNNKRLELI